MSRRYAQVVLLVEDKQQQTFLTRSPRGLGYPPHKLRALPLPAGEGSGEQYVRENYAHEVRELRRRSGHLHGAFVVVTDADNREVGERHQALARQLQLAGLAARQADE